MLKNQANIDAATAPTLETLRAFLDRPIRLNSDNYQGAPDAYRADRHKIVRDREDARALIRWAQTWGVTADDIADADLRLSWSVGAGWDYVPGQYYQTEVCAAVASAVADAIMDEHRVRIDNACPIDPATGAPVANPYSSLLRDIVAYISACNPREGRRLARWFR
jgi:hypothetical protein